MGHGGRRATLLVALALAACGIDRFRKGAAEPDAGVDAQADGDAASPAFCDPSDPNLLVCMRFEDAAVNEVDGAPQPTAPVGLTFVQGRVGQGVSMGAASFVSMPDDPRWYTSAFALEAWVNARALPPDGGRAGIIDSEGRYSIFLYESGRIACSGTVRIYGPNLSADSWTHLACVLDGSQLTLYVNGTAVATASDAGAGTNEGGTADGAPVVATTNIGSNAPSGDLFFGAIDEVRIFRAARTPAQVAAAANR